MPRVNSVIIGFGAGANDFCANHVVSTDLLACKKFLRHSMPGNRIEFAKRDISQPKMSRHFFYKHSFFCRTPRYEPAKSQASGMLEINRPSEPYRSRE